VVEHACHEIAGARLLGAVRTGECAFEKATGVTFWEHLRRHPDVAEWFDRQMRAQVLTFQLPSLLALDWQRAKVVVDIAGGIDWALGFILKAHPHLTGILVDQPR
jgi:hypothetical protein